MLLIAPGDGAWEKVKCTRRDEFSIIGFLPASGGLIAALYLGRREKRALLYAGKVGTGFTQVQSRMMRATGFLIRQLSLDNHESFLKKLFGLIKRMDSDSDTPF
jgi:hypothetical protein